MAAVESDIADEVYLESLGYKQELKRDMTFAGSVGITLGCMQPLLAGGVFQLGMLYGGPVEVVWGFIFCFFFGLFMAVSMAEIASPYVTAGGPYFWSGALAGKLGRFPPFLVGWLILVAFLGGQCSICLQAMFQVVGMRQMYYYGFDTAKTSPAPSQNGEFGVAVAVLVFGAVISALPMKYLNKIAKASLVWICLGATVIIIGLPSIAPQGPNPGAGNRETSKWVWTKNTYALNAKTNGLVAAGLDGYSGLGSSKGQMYFTMANGLLMAQYLILVFDVPGHMAEETKNASRAVPRSILTTYFLGSAFNIALLLSFLYGTTHVKNVSVPGFGITGSCNTNNFDLPPWSTATLTSSDNVLPNNGKPLNKFPGGCILSNGFPFSYFTVGNIFYDAFAARYPRCTPTQAFGPNLNKACVPVYLGGCCDIMGGGSINFNYTTFMATTSDGAMFSTSETALPEVAGAVIYPVPQGIAPTAMARNGAIFFGFIIFMGTMFSSVLNSIAASRFMYSFARDGGFPPLINDLLKIVEPRTNSPVWSIFFFLIGSMLFTVAWTNKSPQVAFSAVSGINSIGFLTVYGMPCLLRFTSGLKIFKQSAGFNLGKLSIPIAVLGMLYGLFSVGTLSMPNLFPVIGHPNNVNFAPIALGAVCIFATVLFPLAIKWPKWGYKGPALVAQADRFKDPLSAPGESVRGAFPGTVEMNGKQVEEPTVDAKPASV